MRRVAAIGEGMLELMDAGPSLLRRGYGGDTLNTAIYLARCLRHSRIAVDYVTAVGNDMVSDGLLAAWRAEGLGIEHIRRVDGRPPGVYWVQTDSAGERRFLYWRRGSAAQQMMANQSPQEWASALVEHSLVYFSGITLAILEPEMRARLMLVLDALRAGGVLLAFDSNYRATLWENASVARSNLEAALRRCHIALVSFDDERLVWEDGSPSATVQRLGALGAAEVVVRNGAAPCLIGRADREISVARTSTLTPRDTTAAGDSFNAAYLAARLLGLEPVEAARRGHSLAEIVIQHPGAIAPCAATDAVTQSFGTAL